MPTCSSALVSPRLFFNATATPEISPLSPPDALPISSAASIYGAHMGVVPPSGAAGLTALTTQVTNGQNQVAGPFMASVPPPPSGWSAYTYASNTATGVFTISADGDGTTVSLP